MNSRGVQSWCKFSRVIWASPVAQVVKNLPAMQETQVWSLGQEDPLEKGMATHSSILAWRIPWTEKPGRLQSMGSQRVRQDWATNTFTFFFTLLRPLTATTLQVLTGFPLCLWQRYQDWNSLVVAREENGSFISGLWLGWWEVPEVREQRTVEGIKLSVGSTKLSVGSTAHWLPVDLSFPLCSQTPVAFWKGQCPDLQDWGSLALPSYGGHVLTSFSLSLEAKSGLWLCHVKLSGSEMSELHIMQTFVSYLLCNSNTPLYLGEPSYLWFYFTEN